jgi:hypothetical protein
VHPGDADRLHARPGAQAYSRRTEDTSNVDSHAGVALGAARHGSTGAEGGADIPPDRTEPSTATPADPPPPLPSRACLDATRAGQGILHGGWWPRSRDPAAELPKLIAGVRAQLGVATRVALNLTAWDSARRRSLQPAASPPPTLVPHRRHGTRHRPVPGRPDSVCPRPRAALTRSDDGLSAAHEPCTGQQTVLAARTVARGGGG